MDQALKAKRQRWRKHEADVEKRTGDRRVRGSGNQPGRPGDNIGDRFRELKSTKHGIISVQALWLSKLSEQALRMNRPPVLELRLHGAPHETDYVLVPEDDCVEMGLSRSGASVRRSRGAGFTVTVECLTQVMDHGAVRVELQCAEPPVARWWVLMPSSSFDVLCGVSHRG